MKEQVNIFPKHTIPVDIFANEYYLNEIQNT